MSLLLNSRKQKHTGPLEHHEHGCWRVVVVFTITQASTSQCMTHRHEVISTRRSSYHITIMILSIENGVFDKLLIV